MRLALAALLAWSASARGDDPVAEIARTAGAGAAVLRIEADFDHDGVPDMALATSDSCGNKTCGFVLFLRGRDGEYRRAGEFGSLPFGYRLTPVAPGQAKLETCSASGEFVRHTSVLVSREGLSTPVTSQASTTDDDRCKPDGRYEWSECAASEYLRSGSCRWTRRTWP